MHALTIAAARRARIVRHTRGDAAADVAAILTLNRLIEKSGCHVRLAVADRPVRYIGEIGDIEYRPDGRLYVEFTTRRRTVAVRVADIDFGRTVRIGDRCTVCRWI